MEIYPAIDLMGGQAVRLVKGVRASREVVGEPLALAAAFRAAPLLHVVDLDGAFSGRIQQLPLIAELARVHPLEVGGGIRTEDDVARLLDAGVSRVVLGTAVLENPALLTHTLAAYGAEKVVVALDVKDGFVAAAGWTATSTVRPRDLAEKLAREGVRYVLCTAVHKDGTLEGPDLDVLAEVSVDGLSVIASGGIGSLDDVRKVKRCHGVVIGKAIYAKRFTLEEALAC
jgi:phosphoribosylformimino-5-aminoimidazole carboxamide ribotide isomerase